MEAWLHGLHRALQLHPGGQHGGEVLQVARGAVAHARQVRCAGGERRRVPASNARGALAQLKGAVEKDALGLDRAVFLGLIMKIIVVI